VTRQGEHRFDTVATTRTNPPWSTGTGTDCNIATIALFYLLLLYFIHLAKSKLQCTECGKMRYRRDGSKLFLSNFQALFLK